MVNGEDRYWVSNYINEDLIINCYKVNGRKVRVSKGNERLWDIEEGIIFILRLEGWVGIR